jgi:membrane protease YdiL (CAAX protease family)
MPTSLDVAFVLLFTVVVTVFDMLYFVPRFKADAKAGVLGARLRAYRRTVFGQWGFALAAVFIWMRAGRSWSELGVMPRGFAGLIGSTVIVALMAALTVQQMRAIGRITPERREALRPKLDYVEYLLPHSRRELAWFTALSITAGVCEELLYRGFLLWVLKAYVAIALAAVIGVALFGVLHLYQGRQGAIKAAAAGAVMTLIYLATHWLVPAMVVHALVDLSGGTLGFKVLGELGDIDSPSVPVAGSMPLR